MQKVLVASVAMALLALGAAPAHGASAAPVRQVSACQGGWRFAVLPPVGGFATLRSVAAISPTDVWAVGDAPGALAMHFDGTSWSVVLNSFGAPALFGVAAASSDDVWVVGGGPLALHWDGTTWSKVPTPSPGPNGGTLNDVAVLAPDDVWAVGLVNGPSEGESATLTEHWDGTSWTIVPSPSAFPNSQFEAVSALSPSDVWAMGVSELDHWDGSAWHLVADLPPSWDKLVLDMVAFGPDDVWATGWTLFPETQPTFDHWDGTTWKDTTGPPIPEWGQIAAIGGPSTDRLWAVGWQPQAILMERWDGTSWRVVPAPSPSGEPQLDDVTVDADGHGWAVGTSQGNPLVEHTCH